MDTPPPETRCNRCQTPIPVDAPVPFCPPCIAAGALQQGVEGPDDENASGPNWPAIGLALGVLGILGVLIFQSIQKEASAESGATTNAPALTNPPPASKPSTP